MEKRIRTTMIGSLELIEKIFGEEIKNNTEFRDKFLILREKILDLGNKQIFLYNKEKGK